MGTIEVRWATEATEWAAVEATHAKMNYLRRAAIIGARTVMDHVGLEEIDQKKVINPPVGLRRDIAWRQTKLIFLDDSDEDNLIYARIQEIHRTNDLSSGKLHGIWSHLFPVGSEPLSTETEQRYDTTRFVIAKFRPGGSGESDIVMPMMNHSQLDVRPNLEWTPEAMTSHYQQQIDQLGVFVSEIEKIALQTETYLYSPHIGEVITNDQSN